jgi:hypothetical protein
VGHDVALAAQRERRRLEPAVQRQPQDPDDEAAGLVGWLGAETRMLPTDGEIKARQITPRLNVVSAEEIARYRREHLGRQGWDKRRAPEYRPSKMAAWVKDYRARRKAATQEPDKMPTEQ